MTLQTWSKVIAHMYKHMKCKWILCLVLAPIRKRPHYVFVNISKSTKVLSPRCCWCPAFWIRNLKIPSLPFYLYHPSIPYLSCCSQRSPSWPSCFDPQSFNFLACAIFFTYKIGLMITVPASLNKMDPGLETQSPRTGNSRGGSRHMIRWVPFSSNT